MTVNIAIVGFAAAAGLHAFFLLLVLRSPARTAAIAASPKVGGQSNLARAALIGALTASLGWTVAGLVDQFSAYLVTRRIAVLLDWLRYGLWMLFLLALLQPRAAGDDRSWRQPSALTVGAGAVWLAGAVLALVPLFGGTNVPAGVAAWWLMAALVLPVLGVVAIEQLFRNLPEDSRWNAKPVCLGLGCIFIFDIYHYSESVLFGRYDADASHMRGLVHALALPLLYRASRRRADWIGRLQVSRQAAFYSASMLLVGGYLLFVAGMGYLVRAWGGDWGRAMQLALLSGALLLGLLLLLSGAMRARLRVFVSKHFFSYRYDYREQWLRFTQMLTASAATQDVGGLVVRGLADMLECPGGALWTRSATRDGLVQTSRWNVPAVPEAETASGTLVPWLRESGWIVDLDEYRNAPKRYGSLALPPWLLGGRDLWLIVPLIVHDDLLGFVVLARPRATLAMNWETRDLIKTASRQAAGFLAQMQATEALLEARKFEAFNRMSAFVVHDLKNIVTQLSLMLKNAERLHANPEFQQDMLLTVQSSLDKMRRLMLQLREGATPPGAAAGVDLPALVQRLVAMAGSRGRELQVRQLGRLATRGHGERLERVLGHLVHNAMDATAEGGDVWIAVTQRAGQVMVEVGDTGTGMTDEFVQTRLFRPFTSTKEAGMGIGMHESRQYVHELGGQINVASEAGGGTVMTVLLPLFDLHPEAETLGNAA